MDEGLKITVKLVGDKVRLDARVGAAAGKPDHL